MARSRNTSPGGAPPSGRATRLRAWRMRFPAWAAWAALWLAAAGCGSRLATAPVQGKVLFRGEPLSHGSVLFQPDVGPPATGTIQPDGSFVLSTYRSGDGAVLGRHRVEVVCPQVPMAEAVKAAETEELALPLSAIPDRYTSYASSGIEREVVSGRNEFTIELTD
jgi:hypothetical protein